MARRSLRRDVTGFMGVAAPAGRRRVVSLTVLFVATAVAAVALADLETLGRRWPEWSAAVPIALGANAALAMTAALALRALTPSGALAGALIGTTVFVTTGWPGWALLACAFATTVITTRVGRERKRRMGTAEPGGRGRAAGNVVANVGLAAIAAVVAASRPDEPAWRAAVAAALAAGACDTAASEIGKALAGPTWLVTSFRRVSAGTTGAVSIAGTAAGVLAAAGFGVMAVATGMAASVAHGAMVAGAVIAAFLAEGAVAIVAEGRVLDNDGVNFVGSALASALAGLAAAVG